MLVSGQKSKVKVWPHHAITAQLNSKNSWKV